MLSSMWKAFRRYMLSSAAMENIQYFRIVPELLDFLVPSRPLGRYRTASQDGPDGSYLSKK